MRNKIFSKVFLLILAVLVFSNMFFLWLNIANQKKIAIYRQELHSLKEKNLVLKNKISFVDSLSYAQSKAEDLGFTQKPQIVSRDFLFFAYNK